MESVLSRRGYFAGEHERRAESFLSYLNDPGIRAVFCARGGYGSNYVVEYLAGRTALSKLKRLPPKIVMGYSDLTTLHLFLYAKLGLPFFYGPVVAKALSATEDPDEFKPALASLASALDGSILASPVSLADALVIRPGQASGPIIGGCLTLLTTSSGTAYGVSFKEHILFIEDVGEKPYRIDRMLTHLRETGRLAGVRGLVCGAFKDCGESAELKRIVLDHFGGMDIPILWNAPYGHRTNMHTLPLGIPCTLDTSPFPSLTYARHLG
jgi:muramoyltetrapeptide carboxypeptidase